MAYLVFFMLCLYLVCANLVGKGFDRSAYLDLRLTLNDTIPWSQKVFLTIFLSIGETLIFKDTF